MWEPESGVPETGFSGYLFSETPTPFHCPQPTLQYLSVPPSLPTPLSTELDLFLRSPAARSHELALKASKLKIFQWKYVEANFILFLILKRLTILFAHLFPELLLAPGKCKGENKVSIPHIEGKV